LNGDENNIRILEEMMFKVRRLARERDASVHDIVNEALDGFLGFHDTGVNLFDVVHSIERILSGTEYFNINVDLQNFAVIVKSPIRYVYRPEIKYRIAIAQNGGSGGTGASAVKINAALRTHDIDALRCFSAFSDIWIALEARYMNPRAQAEYICDAGYFERKAYIPARGRFGGAQEIGSAISSYLTVFDKLFKYCYYHPADAGAEIERMYREHVRNGDLKI